MSYRRSSRYLGCDSEQNGKNKNSVELVFGVGVGSNIDFCREVLNFVDTETTCVWGSLEILLSSFVV